MSAYSRSVLVWDGHIVRFVFWPSGSYRDVVIHCSQAWWLIPSVPVFMHNCNFCCCVWSISAARRFVSLSGSQGVCNSGDFFGPPCGCCPIYVESRLRYFVVENCCNGLSRPWRSNFTCSFYSAVFFVERTTCDDCNCVLGLCSASFFTCLVYDLIVGKYTSRLLWPASCLIWDQVVAIMVIVYWVSLRIRMWTWTLVRKVLLIAINREVADRVVNHRFFVAMLFATRILQLENEHRKYVIYLCQCLK